MIRLKEVWSQEEIDQLKSYGATEVICPICGNETLSNWTICPHCFWEYDEFLYKGYSCANRSYIWWYRIKYKIKKLFKNS